MNYYLGLTIVGIVSGLLAGLIGGGAEIVIVPLLTMFGLLTNIKDRIDITKTNLQLIAKHWQHHVFIPPPIRIGLVVSIKLG